MSGAYGLVGYGNQVKKQAMAGLEKSAQLEQNREIANDNLKAAEKSKRVSSGGMGMGIGYMMAKGTAVGGPWGAAIGLGLGLLSSELF